MRGPTRPLRSPPASTRRQDRSQRGHCDRAAYGSAEELPSRPAVLHRVSSDHDASSSAAPPRLSGRSTWMAVTTIGVPCHASVTRPRHRPLVRWDPVTDGYASGVVVVGAGFAGLAAARSIADAGLETTVLEARERVGGRCGRPRSRTARSWSSAPSGSWTTTRSCVRPPLGSGSPSLTPARRTGVATVGTGRRIARGSGPVHRARERSSGLDGRVCPSGGDEGGCVPRGARRGRCGQGDRDDAPGGHVRVGTCTRWPWRPSAATVRSRRAGTGTCEWKVGTRRSRSSSLRRCGMCGSATRSIAIERNEHGVTVRVGSHAERADAAVVAIPAPIAARMDVRARAPLRPRLGRSRSLSHG